MKFRRIVSAATAAACTAGLIVVAPELAERTYAAEVVYNGFETDYEGWYANDEASQINAVIGAGYEGTRGMTVTGRTSPESGAASSKGFYLEGGKEYDYNIKVYSETDETFHVSLLYKDNETEEETVVELINEDVKGGEWTNLSTEYKAPENTFEYLITITTDSTNDFSFDDVLITEQRSSNTAYAASTQKGLKDEFANYFRVGNILNGGTIRNSTICADYIKDFNSIECENETKPTGTMVQGQSSGTNIAVSLNSCSAIADFCVKNGIGFRGHTFVWHSQTPSWFFKSNLQNNGSWADKNTMDARMESYIKNMFNAFKTQYPSLDLFAYDVCNECVSDDSNRTRNYGGAREPGDSNIQGQGGKSAWVQIYGDNSFVEKAFTYARRYAPSTCKLFYNDYNEYWDHKRDCIYNMCNNLYKKGLLDGVGMQSHINAGYDGFSGVNNYVTAMKKYLSIGCEVHITELDVSLKDNNVVKFNNNDQATKYAALAQAAMDWNDNPQGTGRVTLFQIWGPNDANSWLGSGANGTLRDTNNQPKAAYNKLMSMVPESKWGVGIPYTGPGSNGYSPVPPTPVEPDSNGYYFHHTFEGTTNGWDTRFCEEVLTSGRTNYAGSEALLVKGRTAGWNGAKFDISSNPFEAGKTFSFSANVCYLDGDIESDTFMMKLQYTGADGEPHYDEIASGTAPKGEWLQLANKNYTIPEDASDASIYIETASNDAGEYNNFYIDEVIGAVAGTDVPGAGTPVVRKVVLGDIDFDGSITGFDLTLGRIGLLEGGFEDSKTKQAADVDKSGKFELNDLVLIQEFILGKIQKFPVAERVINSGEIEKLFSGMSINSSWKKDGENNPMTTQRFGADPGWMVYDGRLYIYTTNDAFETYKDGRLQINTYNSGTINCVSTADMVNWTDHGAIPVAARNGRTKNGCASWASAAWAPDACWKMVNGKPKFFLYFANSGGGIGVLTADSPTGPWSDPLGHALLTHGSPNCSDVEWMFDPGVYYDETTDEAYLFFGGGRKNGVDPAKPGTGRVVKLGKDMTSLAGNPVKMDIPYLFEDSSVIKIGDTWYYSYCANWDVGNKTINGVNFGSADILYMTSKDPLSWSTNNLSGNVFKNTGTQRIDNGGNNHHSIIYFKNKYYVAYHSRQQSLRMGNTFIDGGDPNNRNKDNKDGNYRSTQINEASFINGKLTCSGDMKGCTQIETLNPYNKVQAETMSNQSKNISVEGLRDTTVRASKGEWIKVSGAKFSNGSESITVNASSTNGAAIKICAGSTTGDVIGYAEIPSGGKLSELTFPVNNISGTKDVYFVFSGDVVFDWWQFN